MGEVIDSAIEKEMQTSYIDYAMSVIVGRALPDARDGLKPVQRRILYTMQRLNNVHSQPTKKSARIVGDCMGKYHPHGDMAIYDALIRMAQPFTMNHTLVDGQGNMGSIDGDSPAAQRYTEVRLSKLAEEMLEDLDRDAVRFIPNFDNTEKEPVVLPAKLPNLIVNGSSGIAVGVATNILPHNLREVCDAIVEYINNPEVTSEQLTKFVTGPDFPTGGIVFYNNQLYSSYIMGRGSVTIRGRAEVEERKGERSIIITEIPYNVNKAQLNEEIGLLVRNKKVSGISDVRDESGKEGIRIAIELKKDANPEYILNVLYMHTQLQVTFPVMNVAVLDNALLTMNLCQFIKTFVEHRFTTITNRTKFDLNAAEDRLHIVDGLIIATDNIDAVVAAIRRSEDLKAARAALMSGYGLSEKQANAVLDMKLSRLTSLEATSLRTEQNELNMRIRVLRETLEKKSMIYDIIREETAYIKEHYGTDRKTRIERSELPIEIQQEDVIEDVDASIILTKDNYVKRLAAGSFKIQSRGGRGVKAIELKEGDFPKQTLYCRTKDTLLMVSDVGRAYWIKAYKIPEGDRYGAGKAAVNLLNLREGEKIESIINTRDFSGTFIVFITAKGTIKRVSAEKFAKPRSNGVNAIPIRQGDSLADLCISDGVSDLFISTKMGKAIRFSESELRSASRIAHGIRGIRIRQGDRVVNVIPVKEADSVMSVTERGYGKITELGRYRKQHRGGGGMMNVRINTKTGAVVKSLRTSERDALLLISSNGISIEFPLSSVRVTGRAASGVRIMRLDGSNRVVDAQVIGNRLAAGAAEDAPADSEELDSAPAPQPG